MEKLHYVLSSSLATSHKLIFECEGNQCIVFLVILEIGNTIHYFYIIKCNYEIYSQTIETAVAAAKLLQSCLTLCDPIDGSPTRLPLPWDSPGKNTRVGCHFLLQCMKVKSESEVAESCLTHSDPMDYSPPGSSVHGILQARVPEWGAIAFSDLWDRCPEKQLLGNKVHACLTFDPWIRKILWRRAWQPIPLFLPGESL